MAIAGLGNRVNSYCLKWCRNNELLIIHILYNKFAISQGYIVCLKIRHGVEQKNKKFIFIEERMFNDRDIITGEYHLLTKEKNLVKIMQDCFRIILNRKVEVTIEDKAIGLHYEGGDILVADNNNTLGVYGKGIRRVIFWKNGDKYYETVFRSKANGKTYNSIKAYLPADSGLS